MKNNMDQTASQILTEFSFELSQKVNLFHARYGFFPARPGTVGYDQLSPHNQSYSQAFFKHPQISFLLDRIADWSEQCHLLKSYKGK